MIKKATNPTFYVFQPEKSVDITEKVHFPWKSGQTKNGTLVMVEEGIPHNSAYLTHWEGWGILSS